MAAMINCPYCNGAGWVYWEDIPDYNGPAADPFDCYSDDTKYDCPICGGEGKVDDNDC